MFGFVFKWIVLQTVYAPEVFSVAVARNALGKCQNWSKIN